MLTVAKCNDVWSVRDLWYDTVPVTIEVHDDIFTDVVGTAGTGVESDLGLEGHTGHRDVGVCDHSSQRTVVNSVVEELLFD